MSLFKNEGITQKIMAKLANVSNTAVNRYISNNKIEYIETSNQRNLRYHIDDVCKIIKELSSFPKHIKNKVQCFYNFKGGTGKTSVCYQVSSHIALMGYKVLVIDADPQGHLSTSFGFSNESDYLTLYDCVLGKQKIENIIQKVYNGLDCITANLSLTRLEVELNQMPKREERVSIELAEVSKGYDFIFIDTNPTISLLNRNVITFCDILNIVCETQPYSLNGLKLLMEDINKFFQYMQIKNKVINIVPNKYEDRTSSSAEAMTALRTYYFEYVKENFAIRKSEDIVNSSKISRPLAFFAKKNSIALEDIIELIHYLIEKSAA